MLRAVQLFQLQMVSGGKSGQGFILFLRSVVAAFDIQGHKALEFQFGAARLKQVFAGGDIDVHRIINRMLHLTGDEAFPNQLIELIHVVAQRGLDLCRS